MNAKNWLVPVKVVVITNILLFALLDMRGELQELFERRRVCM